MRCKVIEITTTSNVWLQAPWKVFLAVIVEIAWWHRETYLHIGHITNNAIVYNLLNTLKIRKIATIIRYVAWHSGLFANAVHTCAILIAGSKRFLHIYWFASLHCHDGKSCMTTWWCSNIYCIDIRIINELLSIGVPFANMMPFGIRTSFGFTSAHYSLYMRTLNFIESRSRLLFGNLTTTNKSPSYFFHYLIFFIGVIGKFGVFRIIGVFRKIGKFRIIREHSSYIQHKPRHNALHRPLPIQYRQHSLRPRHMGRDRAHERVQGFPYRE